ncbi:MAG: tail fiber domain-containing protein, partial [Bacteroidetes bacterium]|nr:tail fiber domain-containing protein [Bacteroidota bacterium]
MLDVKSVTKGFLAPRVSTLQRTSIPSPATGLLVFDTDLNNFYYYNGSAWIDLTSGTSTGPYWSYISPVIRMTNSTDKLGLGTNAPLHKLHLAESVAVTDGTDGNFIDIQNSNASYGVLSGIRFWNGTTANTGKGGIFYRDTLSYGRGDLIFANRPLSDQVNVTAGDGRLYIRNDGSVEVKGAPTAAGNDALFSVQNPDGDTVFAVYSEGVRIYVADDPAAKTTGSRSGFAVGGFSLSKGITNEYLHVSPDSVRIYVEDTIGGGKAAGSKGGFAVGGFSLSKGLTDEYFTVTDATTQVFVNDPAAGFGVNNIETGTEQAFLDLTAENYFIGHQSGQNNTSGVYNCFLGYEAGAANTEGTGNVFIGYQAGRDNLVADYNTFIGYGSGMSNIGSGGMSGDQNCFMGYKSGNANTTGASNVYIGYMSGYQAQTTSHNTFVGTNSGMNFSLTSNGGNTLIGYNSGMSLQSGNNNSFFGYSSGWQMTNGTHNVMIGNNAGSQQHTGDFNSYLGSESAYYNADGDYNTISGYQAGRGVYGNSYNYCALYGYKAGYSNSTGANNTFLGSYSGYSVETGGFNTMIGYKSGYLGTGSSNVFIGYMAGYFETGNSKLYIDNSSTSSPLIFGDFAANDVQINGDLCYTGTFGACSDKRYKKNFQPVENPLKKINQIQGLYFEWKKDEYPDRIFSDRRQIGVIAQDVEKIFPELIDHDKFGYKTVDYTKLSVILLE